MRAFLGHRLNYLEETLKVLEVLEVGRQPLHGLGMSLFCSASRHQPCTRHGVSERKVSYLCALVRLPLFAVLYPLVSEASTSKVLSPRPWIDIGNKP